MIVQKSSQNLKIRFFESSRSSGVLFCIVVADKFLTMTSSEIRIFLNDVVKDSYFMQKFPENLKVI